MGKVDAKKQIKMNSLLDTAFDLFTTNGVNETSISQISERAGVAKGTFYLYFKDKLDIRDKLIAYKSSKLYEEAITFLEKEPAFDTMSLEDKIIYITDYVLTRLSENKMLLNLISKNLSWGVFKSAFTMELSTNGINMLDYFRKSAGDGIKQPEIMLFMITELAGSSCYNSIMANEPVPFEEYKPYLYDGIRSIIRNFENN